MTRTQRRDRPVRGWRAFRRLALVLALPVLLGGCDPSFGWPKAISLQGERARELWIGASFASLAVGAFVWGLIFYAIIRYRKRSEALPEQVRYNLPIEVLYTVIPVIIVGALFYYTAKDEIYIDKTTTNPQVTVQVVGFRWAWQFNYLSQASHGTVLASVTGQPNALPTLVVPEFETVQFQLVSADVIHSFWVPALLFKRDNVPGLENKFQVTLDRTGTFEGQCAELCGVYHDRMLFYLKVVTPAQYRAYMAGLSRAAPTTSNALASTYGSAS